MIELIAGVDEAGRGPLVGAVLAAAVILDPECPIAGLADSKKLSEKKRVALAAEIREKALAFSIARCDAKEIDQLNILHASMLAMSRAIEGLAVRPTRVLVDGNRCPDCAFPVAAIVKGDALVSAISAASILAKVARDAEMEHLDLQYPAYGFAAHKGYPTKVHQERIMTLGITDQHRLSFRPVRLALEKAGYYSG